MPVVWIIDIGGLDYTPGCLLLSLRGLVDVDGPSAAAMHPGDNIVRQLEQS